MTITRSFLRRLSSALGCGCALLAVAASPAVAQAPAGGKPAASAVKLTLSAAVTGRTDFEARGAAAGGIAVTQAAAKLSVPLRPIDGTWFPSVGLDYRHYDLDLSAGTPLPDELRSLGLSFSAFGKLADGWSVIASVTPSLANAGGGFSSRGLGVGVLAIATKQLRPDFTGGFGLVYDSLSRGTGRLLPVATLDWTPAPAWRVFLGFPRTGASWQIDPALKAEFVAEADFGSFYVTADPAARVAGRPPLDRTRLEYQAVRVGPALTWALSPECEVRLAAGFVPVLNADYHRRDYKLKSDNAAGFASLEFSWKF